jgi:hypothetical protein
MLCEFHGRQAVEFIEDQPETPAIVANISRDGRVLDRAKGTRKGLLVGEPTHPAVYITIGCSCSFELGRPEYDAICYKVNTGRWLCLLIAVLCRILLKRTSSH